MASEESDVKLMSRQEEKRAPLLFYPGLFIPKDGFFDQTDVVQ